MAQPRFEIVPAQAPDDAVRHAVAAVGFPCVVKAVSLSASQGILRAGDAADAVTAARRIRRILAAARHPANEPLLIEEYLPGPELSIDGLLADGDLAPVAIFDKPAMPDGPTFEETHLPRELGAEPRLGASYRHVRHVGGRAYLLSGTAPTDWAANRKCARNGGDARLIRAEG